MKMKTIAALLVSGALMFSLAACGKKAEETAPAPAPAEAPATTPAPAMGGATTAAPAPAK